MPIQLRDSTANALQIAARNNEGKSFRPQFTQKFRKEPKEQHLILVGGGHAHAQVIRALNWASRPSNLKVTLIDQQASVSYSGMVPGCISGVYSADETLLHLQPLADWAGIEFIHDKVVDIDLEQKMVRLGKDDCPQAFDCISIDIGSTSRGLDDTPGAREYTIPTRPISKLVERIDQSIEELEGDARAVVIGGGAAGVELSMSLNGRLQSQFPESAQVTLLDGGTELLPGDSSRGREKLQQIMNEQGIQVVHQCVVDEIDNDRIFATINGKKQIIPFSHCIWATGAGAHPLALRLQKLQGLDVTARGWIRVNEYLQSTSHPFVFAAGDCCHVENLINGSPPKAGVFAVRAGPVLIENLTRYLQQQQEGNKDDTDMQAYVPQTDFMKLLVCGDGAALGLRFGHAFHGKWVMDMKDTIDVNFMDLFRKEYLPDLSPNAPTYDTSQYDAKLSANTSLPPAEGAALLARTDNEVDYQLAWSVIRTMADDEDYRDQVLAVLEKQSHRRKQSAVAA